MGLLKSILICLGLCLVSIRAAYIFRADDAALFVAIAIPIDLPRYKVFMSYNFEAHYNQYRYSGALQLPPILNHTYADAVFDAADYVAEARETVVKDAAKLGGKTKVKQTSGKIAKKPIKKSNQKSAKTAKNKPKLKPKRELQQTEEIDFEDFQDMHDDDVATQNAASNVTRIGRTLLTRSNFYEILNRKLEQHGFGNKDHCLLRLICETNSSKLGEINGVLGNLVHVMFSPSSSRDEALPMRYYAAELQGARNDCEPYHRKCKRSVLDIISSPLIDLVTKLALNKI